MKHSSFVLSFPTIKLILLILLLWTGASAALMISDIPFDNPIAGARIGRVEGNFVFNPTYEESKKSDIQLLMAGTTDGIVMVEAGAKEASEEEMMNALEFWARAH